MASARGVRSRPQADDRSHVEDEEDIRHNQRQRVSLSTERRISSASSSASASTGSCNSQCTEAAIRTEEAVVRTEGNVRLMVDAMNRVVEGVESMKNALLQQFSNAEANSIDELPKVDQLAVMEVLILLV